MGGQGGNCPSEVKRALENLLNHLFCFSWHSQKKRSSASSPLISQTETSTRGKKAIYICGLAAYHNSGNLGLPLHLFQVTLNDSKICGPAGSSAPCSQFPWSGRCSAISRKDHQRSLKPSDPFPARPRRTNCV